MKEGGGGGGGEKDEKELQVIAHIITMYMQWYILFGLLLSNQTCACV